MLGERLSQGIPQGEIIGSRRPVVELVLVAAATAVKEVLQVIAPASGYGLVVVNGQLAADIGLRDTSDRRP